MATEIFVEHYDDYEIIEGEKFMAASPNWGHVNITANLIGTIGVYARINKLGVICTVRSLQSIHWHICRGCVGSSYQKRSPLCIHVTTAQNNSPKNKKNVYYSFHYCKVYIFTTCKDTSFLSIVAKNLIIRNKIGLSSIFSKIFTLSLKSSFSLSLQSEILLSL